jgi:tetratricopeptide (TPR) repeat protein
MRLLARGRIEEALSLLEQAALTAPNDWSVQEALGHAWLQDGRLPRASAAYERCATLDPSRPQPHVLLADVFSAMGQRNSAEQSIRRAIQLAPSFGAAWLRLAHLRRFRNKTDPDLRQMRAIARAKELSQADREALHFALAKAYDDLRCVNDAFRHMQLANEMRKRQTPFDMCAMEQLVSRIVRVCDDAFFDRCHAMGSDSALPVFLVGMPRSGSSLIEQILATHPLAHGVGELGTLGRLTADLPTRLGTATPFPECLHELTREGARTMASDYLRRLERDAPKDVLRICDKMLSHLLLVGLIAVLFPSARIVYCRRNLMDLGLSIYLQSFAGGGVGYAYDLDDIGRYYQLTKRLMDHWKRVSPIRIFEMEYESLVQDPEPQARALMKAVELPWDARCLDFHRSTREVRTVSHWQVRQPIHNRSVERWRPYARHLAPLQKYLDG